MANLPNGKLKSFRPRIDVLWLAPNPQGSTGETLHRPFKTCNSWTIRCDSVGNTGILTP